MNKWNGSHKGTQVLLEELPDGGTKVIRRSPFTSKLTEKDYDISFDRFIVYYGGSSGLLIQQAFPELSADDREFIMTGLTPADWATLPEE